MDHKLKYCAGINSKKYRRLFFSFVICQGAFLRACCDKVCSRVLERMLDFCSTANLARVLRQAVPLSARLLADRCGSNVLQAIVVKAAALVEPDEEPEPDTLGDPESVPGEDVSVITMIDFVARDLEEHISE